MLPLLAWIVLGLSWLGSQPGLAAQPTITEQPRGVSVGVGLTATLQVTAGSTNGPLRYQWYFNSAAVPGATKNPLVLTNIQLSQAGPYYVVVSDDGGSTQSDTATVQVGPTFIKITGQPISDNTEQWTTCAWCDYDGDGYLDAFVGNAGKDSLYHNEGNGSFTRVSNALTIGTDITYGATWADYDNDGRPDLFRVHWSGAASELFRNLGGGQFGAVSTPWLLPNQNQIDCAWSDLDGDGWVDLVVTAWASKGNQAFRNLGDGRCQQLTTNEVGALVADTGFTTSPSFADFDNDGDPDVYVGRRSGRQLFCRNQGGGMYENVQLGSLPGASSRAGGIWGDYNNDGFFDLLTTPDNAWGLCALYMNVKGETFQDVTAAAGVVTPLVIVWGAGSGDFDNDGDLDFFLPNYTRPSSGGSNYMFLNNSDGTFSSVDIGSPVREGVDPECAVFVDYNNDGFLDLFVTCGEGSASRNLLYRNNLSATGNTNHWLKVALIGTGSNRSGIGAKIRVRAVLHGQKVSQLRQIASNGAYSSGTELVAHFGVADASIVESLAVEWPSGSVTELTNVTANQFLTIRETDVLLPPSVYTAPGSNITLRATVLMEVASPSYQWKLNGTNLPGATTDTLVLNNIQVADAGAYTVEVSDGTHIYLSNPCTVTVYDKPVITRQPESVTVIEGSNATFTVTAKSATTLRYQWRFNSTALADKTNSTLSLSNVQAEDDGLYDVVVSDDFGSVTSVVARLTVLLKPRITQLATNYTVVQGGSVTLSIETSGALPIGYRWRRNSSNVTNLVLSSHQSFLVLTNVQSNMGGTSNRYWVILTNVAHISPGVVSSNIYVTILADSDSDGMDDPWEVERGLHEHEPPHATADHDGDGICNEDEYKAGTDPSDANSCLKVDRIAVTGEARIEFRAAANKTYMVQYTESLSNLVWHKLADVVASPESRTVVVTDPGSAAQRYYRLVTPAQP